MMGGVIKIMKNLLAHVEMLPLEYVHTQIPSTEETGVCTLQSQTVNGKTQAQENAQIPIRTVEPVDTKSSSALLMLRVNISIYTEECEGPQETVIRWIWVNKQQTLHCHKDLIN